MTRDDWHKRVSGLPNSEAVEYLTGVIADLTEDAMSDAQTLKVEAERAGASLSITQGMILALLLRRFGQAVTRERIEAYMGAHLSSERWTLSSMLRYIRRALRELAWGVQITTIRGVGYRAETKDGEVRADPLA